MERSPPSDRAGLLRLDAGHLKAWGSAGSPGAVFTSCSNGPVEPENQRPWLAGEGASPSTLRETCPGRGALDVGNPENTGSPAPPWGVEIHRLLAAQRVPFQASRRPGRASVPCAHGAGRRCLRGDKQTSWASGNQLSTERARRTAGAVLLEGLPRRGQGGWQAGPTPQGTVGLAGQRDQHTGLTARWAQPAEDPVVAKRLGRRGQSGAGERSGRRPREPGSPGGWRDLPELSSASQRLQRGERHLGTALLTHSWSCPQLSPVPQPLLLLKPWASDWEHVGSPPHSTPTLCNST